MTDCVFYVAAALLVVSSLLVITSRNPVRSVLFLVLCFFCSSILWMLLEAEFLALVLIFVYVGAVMTLFLFVVMMLHIDLEKLKTNFVRYLPIGALIVLGMIGLMGYIIAPEHFSLLAPAHHGADYSNIKELGTALYTHYVYPFELAAVILIVAIISAISLAHRGPRGRKSQDVPSQLNIQRNDRVRLVDVPAEKKE
ncbi:MAG: NADH:ubiquinone oxidoreductase subunit J [Legionellales bacterium]|nr:NADH:ubiquinone oxidoreductase subunit J [Legionellales bacterium]